MIYATPGSTIEAVTQFATGLAGTAGIRVRDNAGNDAVAHTTSGIVEDIAGSGIYRKTLTAPTASGQYTIVWDNGSGVYTIEELVVSYSTASPVVEAHAYVGVAAFKESLSLTGQTFADNDIANAINAASRAIDEMTGRRFWLDDDNTSVRYYTPEDWRLLLIDDVVEIVSVAIDRSGAGSFSESWTANTHYVLEPFNSAADGRPYELIRVRKSAGVYLPSGLERSVRVTGQFGWSDVPADIYTATSILAHKLVRRTREAPFGVVAFTGVDATATAVRIARTDPDIANLVSGYIRHTPFI